MSPDDLSWGPMSHAIRNGAPKTLADEAFQRIREDIVKSRLKPGDKLQPDHLRALYDIGLSPVREALSRLASDGLAVAEGQRGFFVAPVSIGELLDVAESPGAVLAPGARPVDPERRRGVGSGHRRRLLPAQQAGQAYEDLARVLCR